MTQAVFVVVVLFFFCVCVCLRQLNNLLKTLPKATFHRWHKIILKTSGKKFFVLLLWYVLFIFTGI